MVDNLNLSNTYAELNTNFRVSKLIDKKAMEDARVNIPIEDMPEIPRFTNLLDIKMGETHKLIEGLLEKLRLVMPEVEDGIKDGHCAGKPLQDFGSLGDKLNDLVAVAETTNIRLRGIISAVRL